MRRVLFVAVALMAGLVSAQAGTVHISAMGFYTTETTGEEPSPNSSTLYSSPGGTWSFQFDVTAPLGSNPVSVTNFSFFNNNALVSDPLSNVQFYDAEDGGLFGLFFSSGGLVNFFGNPVGGPFGGLNGPSVSPPYPIVLGTYDVAGLFALSGGNFSEGGGGTIQISAVPGPIVGAGLPGVLMAAGFIGWRRSRRLGDRIHHRRHKLQLFCFRMPGRGFS
jgi:hypothetical protein